MVILTLEHHYLEIVNEIESILIEFANGNTYIGTSI